MHHMNEKQRKKLIKRAGGVATVASIFGVKRQAIDQWITKGIPANRAKRLALLCDVDPAEIRPDIFGEVA